MTLKLLGYTAAVFGLIAFLLFVYENGKEAGINEQKAEQAEISKQAQDLYQKKLRLRMEALDKAYKESERAYRADWQEKLRVAEELAKQHATADDKADQINEKIENITTVCDSISDGIGADAYSVYRETRSIISRPVPSTTEDTTAKENLH